MKIFRRLAHRVTSRHTWLLALDDGQGRRPATVHLTCRPCGVDKPMPTAAAAEPCFCRDARCDRWQAYVARYVADFGVAPSRDDIAVDERLHQVKREMIAEYGTSGYPEPFMAALALQQHAIARNTWEVAW